jgi:Skp family chaperone for outer membrane proteins
VKKLLIILTAAAGVCVSVVWLPIACGQSGGTSARPPRPVPALRIACLDMAEVLRQYKKSDDILQDVKAQFDAGNAKIQQLVGQGRDLEKSLQDGTLDKESSEYTEREKKVIQLSVNVKNFKSVKEKELKAGQAKALLGIYRDVAAVTQQLAEQNGYGLVLRIDREAAAARSYQSITQTLNESVLRHDPRDDITDVVVAQLNRQYDAAAGGESNATRGGTAAGTKSAKSNPGPREAAPSPQRRNFAR